MKLDEIIERERVHMWNYLQILVPDTQKYLNDDNIEPGTNEPSIDIRLCIDQDGSWAFRTGSADYDQSHSYYCAASSIQSETGSDDLLKELLNQLEEGE